MLSLSNPEFAFAFLKAKNMKYNFNRIMASFFEY